MGGVLKVALAAVVLALAVALLVDLTDDERSPSRGGTDNSAVTYNAAALMEALPDRSDFTQGRSYVPAYSGMWEGEKRGHVDVTVTLNIHNTSSVEPLLVDRIDYFSTSGERLRSYLAEPIAIRPSATAQLLLGTLGTTEDRAAKFIIDWSIKPRGPQPLVEAVMIGAVGTTSHSFVSRAQTVEPR